jgi:hypothetical protein
LAEVQTKVKAADRLAAAAADWLLHWCLLRLRVGVGPLHCSAPALKREQDTLQVLQLLRKGRLLLL